MLGFEAFRSFVGHGDRHLTPFNQQLSGSSACPYDLWQRALA